MSRNRLLLFGPLGALLLLAGVAFLPLMIPGYDPVRQTVSEIGEVGSPAQAPFAAMLWAVAACVMLFAVALHSLALNAGWSRWPAWLTAAMAVSAAGVGAFAFPHPLHNLFGISELVGYQAPLAAAIAWRRDRAVGGFSALMAGLVWLAIAANLATFDREGAIFAAIRPVYGLVQRALFAAWFVWVAGLGLILARRG